ncbi:biopolymer transporter ExbD [bacterium]|nr:biopolymer transporter ExbD [bacterium]NUN46677.1 biopolymer transporter ExbD [bacterium]
MAFKPSAAKKNKRSEEGTLNMNSMMDILTIMLLFLLMNFSTSGALATKSDGMQPPKIVTKNKPKKMLLINVSQAHIYYNKDVIADTETVLAQKNSFLIPQLAEKLEEDANKALDLEARFGIEFKREVIVVCDDRTPFNVLMKVVVTCGRNQFSNLRLLGALANKNDVI